MPRAPPPARLLSFPLPTPLRMYCHRWIVERPQGKMQAACTRSRGLRHASTTLFGCFSRVHAGSPLTAGRRLQAGTGRVRAGGLRVMGTRVPPTACMGSPEPPGPGSGHTEAARHGGQAGSAADHPARCLGPAEHAGQQAPGRGGSAWWEEPPDSSLASSHTRRLLPFCKIHTHPLHTKTCPPSSHKHRQTTGCRNSALQIPLAAVWPLKALKKKSDKQR